MKNVINYWTCVTPANYLFTRNSFHSGVKSGEMSEGDKMKDQPKKMEATEKPMEVSKQEVTQEKSEPVSVAVPASAVVPMTKNMQADQDLDKVNPSEGESQSSSVSSHSKRSN